MELVWFDMELLVVQQSCKQVRP